MPAPAHEMADQYCYLQFSIFPFQIAVFGVVRSFNLIIKHRLPLSLHVYELSKRTILSLSYSNSALPFNSVFPPIRFSFLKKVMLSVITCMSSKKALELHSSIATCCILYWILQEFHENRLRSCLSNNFFVSPGGILSIYNASHSLIGWNNDASSICNLLQKQKPVNFRSGG